MKFVLERWMRMDQATPRWRFSTRENIIIILEMKQKREALLQIERDSISFASKQPS